MFLHPLLRRVARSDRGAAIIEFAMVVAPMLALMIATMETALVYFAGEGVETAAEAAGRSIATGQASSTATSSGYQTQSQFQKSACAKLPPYMSCSNLYVDVQTASSFSAASTTVPTITFQNGKPSNSFSYSTGTTGDVVILRLMYIWPVPVGPLGFNLSNLSNGSRLLIATEVFKSEPYAVSSAGL